MDRRQIKRRNVDNQLKEKSSKKLFITFAKNRETKIKMAPQFWQSIYRINKPDNQNQVDYQAQNIINN